MSNDNRFDDPGVGELDPGARADRGENRMSKKASKSPWNVQVDVILTKGCPDPEFEIYTTLPVQDGNIVFQNNHRPGYSIDFNLYDETGSNPPYKFPPQSHVKEACWSKLGTTCPTSPCHDVFDPKHVDNTGTILTVYNDNPTPALGVFQYALRVTQDGGGNYCRLDPGGNDMNGPRI
jgi:hypothetical protein